MLPALTNQFITLLKASSEVYFLGLIARPRELLQGDTTSGAQTRSLSALVTSDPFYLILASPLTHLVSHRRSTPPQPRYSSATRDH